MADGDYENLIASIVLNKPVKHSPFKQTVISRLSFCLQELQTQLTQRAEQYHRLLDQGESMLLARGGEEAGPGTTQTQQNLGLLQNKWASLTTKMEDRRVRQWESVGLL